MAVEGDSVVLCLLINCGEGPGAPGRKSDSQTGPAEESGNNVRIYTLLFALLKNMAFLFHIRNNNNKRI